ncbi:MAG: NeuD/PglB/VioB family sugar acetyltransferase [Candidatus Woesearchaeota archaeon]
MKKQDIILIGGGGHCKSCIDVIEQEGIYDIVGIVDLPEKKGEKILGYDIFANDDDISELANKYENFFITLGHLDSPHRRIELFTLLKELNKALPVIVSPNAYISKHAKIDEGTIAMHHTVINAGSKIGKNCIINNKALIEHDAIIGDHCHISTGALVNGGVHVGNNTFFGSGAVSRQYIHIQDNSFIKANSIIK